MNREITVSKHFKKRFKHRIANSSRIEHFVSEAYNNGIDPAEIKDKRLRNKMKDIEKRYPGYYFLRIYQGFTYIFDCYTNTAITVYKMPRV